MNPRWLLVPAAIAAIAGVVYHWQSLGAATRLDAETQRVRAESRDLAQKNEDLSRRLAVARNGAQALADTGAERASPSSTAVADAPAHKTETTAPSSGKVVASDPELRSLQVQVFVSEQRLRFGGLLKRLGFTPEKLAAFDRIHATYQQAMLDSAPSTDARAQAAQTRQAALEALFGADFDQWREANRTEPARAVVAQIVQHAFQGSGSLTTGQVDELTRIVGQHRLAPSGDPRAAQPRYDWNAIVEQTGTFLTETQRKDVATAIEYLRTSEQMSVLAAKKKS